MREMCPMKCKSIAYLLNGLFLGISKVVLKYKNKYGLNMGQTTSPTLRACIIRPSTIVSHFRNLQNSNCV